MGTGRKMAQEWETLSKMNGKEKLSYIWDYGKLPIAAVCLLIYLIGSMVYGKVTSRECVLYAALVNVSAGDSLVKQMTDGFLDAVQENPDKKAVQLYSGLYLTEDENSLYYEYTYASQLKLLASIEGQLLDVVLMNREAFDAFSQNGYLADLEQLFGGGEIDPQIAPYLRANTVILEESAQDGQQNFAADPADAREQMVGIAVSQKGLFSEAEFDGEVYLGVLQNSPRKDAAKSYIRFLLGCEGDLD